MATHPKGQIAAAVNQNKATNGYYVQVAKLMKFWRDRLQAHKETFLTGSYARSTAIKDIKDVDEICLLDINPAITQPEVVLAWMDEVSL